VRATFDLPEQRVVMAELSLGPLLAAAARPASVTPLSSFPAVREDLAFIVEDGITAEQMLTALRVASGNLLREATLFDIYRGSPIPAGRKSLACRLTYQADDRTLSAEEMTRLRNRIIKRMQQELGAELRG
jgi:phenylalanyl-tRNA synthetase beta chain